MSTQEKKTATPTDSATNKNQQPSKPEANAKKDATHNTPGEKRTGKV